MKKNIFFEVVWRIALLFTIPMLLTFITDELRGFFGDIYRPDKFNGMIDKDWIWGSRHFWFAWGSFFIWVAAIVNSIYSLMHMVEENEINKNNK